MVELVSKHGRARRNGMKSFAEQFASYRAQHAQRTNQIIHYISVPALLIGILLGLSWISISVAGQWHITFAWIATIALLIYYYFLDVKLAAVMTVVLFILTLICTWIAFPTPTSFSLILFLILFIGGIILEFIGHNIEKSTSAIISRLTQCLTEPLFLLAEAIIALNLEKYFDLESPTNTNT